MDLNSILPLLMRKDADKSQLLSALMPQNEKTGEIMQLMNLMNTSRPKPTGLAPIRDIASNEILGALLKYFSRPQNTRSHT
ncbi:MAG: hypothetical protein HFK10_06995 [Clostridia bacterium]|nr:hypothetical protein [Clostridia bacterium]